MAPKKKVTGLIKLQINAGAANPAPPIGPALGQHGVNIMEFCKAYNEATESQRGNVIPVEITVYEDRSFTFVTKTPPAAELIKKAAGVPKGVRRAAQDRSEEHTSELQSHSEISYAVFCFGGAIIFTTSSMDSGEGREVWPTKPVTPGVLRTTDHDSSVRSIRTKR